MNILPYEQLKKRGDYMKGEKNIKLKAIMALRQETLRTLAYKTGLAEASLCRKINGNRQFKEDEIIKIAEALECSVYDIFFNK